MKSQNLRRSQFILTYGPGSIIEGDNGPRIIPTIDIGLRSFDEDTLNEFEIADVRLRSVLSQNSEEEAKIFLFPSNSSLNRPENAVIYNTNIFPLWRICHEKAHKDHILHKGRNCPICKKESSINVRFVSACTEGHLDDVDWNKAVHGSKKCRSNYFYWESKGSSLNDIIIKCPSCNSSTTMGEIYHKEFDCSGWFPENEESSAYYRHPTKNYNCSAKMKVLQRQSTALRIAETYTLLTIPKYDDPIAKIIQKNEKIVTGSIKRSKDKNELLEFLSDFGIPKISIDTINKYISNNGHDNFVKYVKDILNKDINLNTILNEEYESLKGAHKSSDHFNKRNPIEKKFSYYPNFSFKLYPIDTLRTVTVQKGYRRLPYLKKNGQSKLIPSAIETLDGFLWYPGFESIGEGIFITSKQNPLNFVDSKIVDDWKNRMNVADDTWHGNQISWREGDVRDPQFVWWHTFSHALIRVLAVNSGYSSASLRERIYVDSNKERGGILIYTSSAGNDGGMGGLVETVEIFYELIDLLWESLLLCSNDPLCSEMRISANRVNGAACHSCLMTSETSCEHGNRWLDRHIILRR